MSEPIARETKSFTTSGNHVLAIKTWVSGREFNEIQGVYLSEMKLSVVGGKPQIESFNPLVEKKATEKLIEVMVVSFDGKTTGIVDAILDLPVEEYDEVIAKIKEVSDSKKK